MFHKRFSVAVCFLVVRSFVRSFRRLRKLEQDPVFDNGFNKFISNLPPDCHYTFLNKIDREENKKVRNTFGYSCEYSIIMMLQIYVSFP